MPDEDTVQPPAPWFDKAFDQTLHDVSRQEGRQGRGSSEPPDLRLDQPIENTLLSESRSEQR